MKKVIKYISNGLAIMIFALTAYIIVATVGAFAQHKDVNIFGYSISVVATNSMEDTINVGDFVIYNHQEFSEAEVGDIVVFQYIGSNQQLAGKKIVHRIVGVNPNGSFITRGDKYTVSDPEALTEENFVGKVVIYTALFGLGSLRLNSLSVFFAVIIFGFLILIIIEIRNFIKNYQKLLAEERAKKEQEEKDKQNQ